MTRVALVRQPSPSLADGIVTHIDRIPVDVQAATSQWHRYVEALTGAGWTVSHIAPDANCPDAVFIEDTAVVFGATAVACRPGADSRVPEVPPVRSELSLLGLRVLELSAPATLDGGDVMKVGRTVYVGTGGRTNNHAVEQLAALLTPEGWSVVAVPMSRVLHLKSAVTALPDGRVIGWPGALDDTTVFDSTGGFIAMPEERGAHVVDLGDSQLLMASGCPDSEALLRNLGYTPVPVDIGEFEKLEGCVTCLSIRIRELPT